MVVINEAYQNQDNKWIENFYIKTETINYHPKAIDYLVYGQLNLERLIKNNKFIIRFKYFNPYFSGGVIKAKLYINNKEYEFKLNHIKENSEFNFICISELTKGLTNEVFENIENINISISGIKYGFNVEEKITDFVYKISNINQNKEIKVQSKGIIINFLNNLIIDSNVDIENSDKFIHFESRKYTQFNFYPTLLKQNQLNKTLYQVSINKVFNDKNIDEDIKQSDVYNIKLKSEFNTSLIDGDIKLLFNPYDLKNGITFDNYSYYDKIKQKIIVSANSNQAQKGLLIPPNFFGNLNHKTTINFGNKDKTFVLIYNQVFLKPLLNLYKGLIKLNIEKHQQKIINIKYHKLKEESIPKIIKRATSIEEIIKLGE
ncbi:hypothetical protein FJO69_01925 [[Mycoplasma] falconis]|uniref:Uncharacterized protein n=1 Tax=[Mycoplasma] falconis TaxID=92403 RepID=A0A501XAN0_9BACT|nr:hypothetical protein [[Mycoplasma] falconis]TPE57364.1 hypothetical protein FJO69_01925 [[Mycoplasma] falconis]